MSLYDSIANSLSKQGITTGVGGAVNSVVGGGIGAAIGDTAFGKSTFGKAIANVGTSIARNAAVGVINKYIPGQYQKMVGAGTGAIGDIMSGDFSSAGLRLFDSGLLDNILPGMGGVGSQARFFGTPTPLFGGLTPEQARSILQEVHSSRHARKNLWLIEVGSILGDVSGKFNMFVTDVEYAPMTITGEKQKIGTAHADIVNSSDPVELRMTAYDDESGFVKNWFRYHATVAAPGDGTVGVPADYAIKIKVVHAFVSRDIAREAYEDVGIFRVGNMDISQSRREDGLQELQLSFVQLDTFVDHNTVSG